MRATARAVNGVEGEEPLRAIWRAERLVYDGDDGWNREGKNDGARDCEERHVRVLYQRVMVCKWRSGKVLRRQFREAKMDVYL